MSSRVVTVRSELPGLTIIQISGPSGPPAVCSQQDQGVALGEALKARLSPACVIGVLAGLACEDTKEEILSGGGQS